MNARMEKAAVVLARFALGASFLNGIASRFGLYGPDRGYGNFENFVKYTARVNSFMPAKTIPFLAWSATAAELGLGLLLVVGVWPKWTALATAALLFLFGTAMWISFGIIDPMDYSVYSAMSAALLVAVYEQRREEQPHA